MSIKDLGIIDISSDEDASASPLVPRIQSSATSRITTSSTSTAHTSNNASVSVTRSSSSLPRGRVLAGKTFAFRGTWLTMSTEAAEELCKANGGEVCLAITARAQYVVMGGKGTTQNAKKFTEHGATLITEADFLGTILAQGSPNKENSHHVAGASATQKRPLEDTTSGPSKPYKAPRKSDSSASAGEEDMKWLHYFLMERQNEVRLEGKTLTAFDCGGQVYKAQRGKSAVELLRKFNQFLADCEGEYHFHIH